MTTKKITERRILDHSDLVIEVHYNKHGKAFFVGKSARYEPYEASASSVFDCFFCFDIQLDEQKRIAVLLNEKDDFEK